MVGVRTQSAVPPPKRVPLRRDAFFEFTSRAKVTLSVPQIFSNLRNRACSFSDKGGASQDVVLLSLQHPRGMPLGNTR
eukprot:scaffold128088_cov41-Attheya_sp.AAC.1